MSIAYTAETLKKIDTLTVDAAFNTELAKAENAEQVKALYQTNGVEIDNVTAEDIVTRVTAIRNGDELDDETLEMVNGGGFLGNLVGSMFIGGTFGGMTAGVPGAVAGTVAGGTAYIVGSAIRGIGNLFF